MTMVKCVAVGQISNDGGLYERVLGLVEEVSPWFQFVRFDCL